MTDARDDRAAGVRCPYCDAVADDYTGINGAVRPEPGDASVVLCCGRLAVFEGTLERLRLRATTDEELVQLTGERDVRRALAIVNRFRRS